MSKSIVTVNLTRPQVEHLLSALSDVRREGSYYGNKAQYWARHESIERLLVKASNEP